VKQCFYCEVDYENEERNFRPIPTNKDGFSVECKKCERQRCRKPKMKTYEMTIDSDDEFMAFEAWCAIGCETDQDWAEHTIEKFRQMVKAWTTARRNYKHYPDLIRCKLER
jgi:hypothetical protein